MNVVIIGADSGLGAALTEKFIMEGHGVAAGVLDTRRAEETYGKRGDGPLILRTDVTNEATLRSAAEEVKSKWESVDAVITVAGILPPGDRVNNLLDTDLDELRLVLEVNAIGIITSFRSFYPILKKPRGQLIAITAAGGCFSMDGLVFPAYCVSKTAANKIVYTIKNTLNDARVLAIHPGVVNTGMGRTPAGIEPGESAGGIYDIVLGKIPLKESEWFINYKGEALPL